MGRQKEDSQPAISQGEGPGNLADLLISDVQPPDLSENKSVLSKPPHLRHCVMAALAN